MVSLSSAPYIQLHDAVLPDGLLKEVQDYLALTAWQFGAKSSTDSTDYPYWFKNFGGLGRDDTADCIGDVERDAPVIANVWDCVRREVEGHKLVRCYANGYPYGCEGLPHRDSNNPDDRSLLFYANPTWAPNWSGETVFLKNETDIIAAVLPKPNRMVVFQGNVPHVARGISRSCPLLRITLMFKTRPIT